MSQNMLASFYYWNNNVHYIPSYMQFNQKTGNQKVKIKPPIGVFFLALVCPTRMACQKRVRGNVSPVQLWQNRNPSGLAPAGWETHSGTWPLTLSPELDFWAGKPYDAIHQSPRPGPREWDRLSNAIVRSGDSICCSAPLLIGRALKGKQNSLWARMPSTKSWCSRLKR